MEDVLCGRLFHILFVIFFNNVQGKNSTTPKSSLNISATIGSGDITVACPGSSSFRIYPTVFVVFVLAVIICCLGTCCGVTARRRSNIQRRRAAQQRQMVNGYASLMIAVIADLMSSNSQANDGTTDPDDIQPRTEFKGPPSYEEVTKNEIEAPPPYSTLDLGRSKSVKEPDT